ncbi:MAG TPA: PLP-dependent aminotransferase family protein, partial [Chroococcales cyanobacterium]
MSFYYHGFSHRTEHIKPSAIREALKIIAQPDIISFAGGLPAGELFPREDLREICNRLLSDPVMGAAMLQYNLTEGYPPLRQYLAEELNREGIAAHENNIIITTGSQQSLDLLGKIFLNPDDKVVVENPTYVGALQSFSAYQAQYLTIPCDDEGMRVDQLETVLKNYKPKLIYVVSNFSNPTGVTMSRYRREVLHQLAYQHQVPIVEDDPYGETRYSGEHIPTI